MHPPPLSMLAVGIFATGAIIGYLVGLNASQKVHASNAFVLLVGLTFTSAVDKSVFKTMFSVYAEYIERNEPTTLSYSIADSDKDPNCVVIIERYKDKDAYLKIHKISPQFLEFRSKMAAMDISIDGHSYFETDIGFLS